MAVSIPVDQRRGEEFPGSRTRVIPGHSALSWAAQLTDTADADDQDFHFDELEHRAETKRADLATVQILSRAETGGSQSFSSVLRRVTAPPFSYHESTLIV